MTRFTIVVAAFSFLFLASQASAGTITYSDSDFQNADWSVVEVLDETPNDSFTFSGTRLTSGGNPGAYRRVVNQLNTPTGSAIAAGHFRTGATFDPGQDGTFLSFDFSVDGISQPGNPAGAMAYGLVVEQGGNFFRVGLGQVLDGAGWMNFSATDLVESNFTALGAGALDLSDSGGLVSLGVFVSNGTFGTPSINTGGFDNWSVTVNTISEPGGLLVLSAALVFLSFRKKRYRM